MKTLILYTENDEEAERQLLLKLADSSFTTERISRENVHWDEFLNTSNDQHSQAIR